MSHGLDFTKGRAAMAYAGNNLPWHGYGESMPEGENWSLDTWLEKAGANFEVVPIPSEYQWNGEYRTVPNRVQLVRNDSGASLSEMSANSYKIHQPRELFEFFRNITDESGDFQMRTAGVLHGGRKLWAMAERKGGGLTVGEGVVKPFLLLCGSFDGTMCSTGRFTTVEVVCQNTLAMATSGKQNGIAKQKHSSDFNLDKMQIDLGAFDESFAKHIEMLNGMTEIKMTEEMIIRYFAKLYAPEAFENDENWRKSKMVFDDDVSTNKKNVLADLVNHYEDNLGHALAGNTGTLYGALRTVTFYQDHEARTKGGKRWESATIGAGNRTKNEALDLALEVLNA